MPLELVHSQFQIMQTRSMQERLPSSGFFDVLLKVFHQDAKSRLLGGDPPCGGMLAYCGCVGVYGGSGVVGPA